MPFYSADQVVGYTLYARTRVPIKSEPSDAAEAIGEILPGRAVGVVRSWIDPKPGRNANLYWQFQGSNGALYYAEHRQGRFSETALADQGALDVVDQQNQNAEPPTLQQTITKLFTFGVVLWAGSAVLKEVIRASAYKRARRDRYMDFYF